MGLGGGDFTQSPPAIPLSCVCIANHQPPLRVCAVVPPPRRRSCSCDEANSCGSRGWHTHGAAHAAVKAASGGHLVLEPGGPQLFVSDCEGFQPAWIWRRPGGTHLMAPAGLIGVSLQDHFVVVVEVSLSHQAQSIMGGPMVNEQIEPIEPMAVRELRGRHHRLYLRAGYLSLKTALVIAVAGRAWALETHESSEHDFRMWLCGAVLIAFLLCTASYFFVQGSDPGYLDEDMIRRAIEANGGEEQLTTSEVTAGEDEGEMDDLLASRVRSSRFTREKQYHLRRIQIIETALGGGSPSCHLEADHTEDLRGEDGIFVKTPTMKKDSSIDCFCVDCDVFAPLRAHHCRICNRCVAMFDHHCIVLGTCIGEKNHCRFWWFLVFQTIEIMTALAIVSFSFESSVPASSSWSFVNGWVIAIAICLLSLLLFVGGLLVFHTYLAMTCTTTYEFGHDPEQLSYMTGFRECDLPFSRGLVSNLAHFCRPLVLSCSLTQHDVWVPMFWHRPLPIERDSTSICENLWENKYYSCC